MIAVVDLERANGRVSIQLKWAMKIPVEGYIRTHPLFAISPQLFSKIRWLADLSTLECLSGTEIGVGPVAPEYQGFLRAITVLEIGIHKLFALRVMVLGEGLTTRNLLLTLNSIGYSLFLAEMLHPCDSLFQRTDSPIS